MTLSKSKQKKLDTLLKGRTEEWLRETIKRLVNDSPGLYEVVLKEVIRLDGAKNGLADALLMEYWEKAQREIQSAYLLDDSDYEYDEYDYDEDIEQQSEYLKQAKQYIKAATQKTRQRLIAAAAQLYEEDSGGYQNDLMAFCHALCLNESDWRFLIDILEQQLSDNEEQILEILLKIGDDNSYEMRRINRLLSALDYEDLVKFYQKNHNSAKAVYYANQGLRQGVGSLRFLADYLLEHYRKIQDANGLQLVVDTCEMRKSYALDAARSAFDYFRQLHDYEQAKIYLLKICELSHGTFCVGIYEDVKNFLTTEDFKGVEEELLRHIKRENTEEYLDILIGRREYQKAYQVMVKNASPQLHWYSTRDYLKAAKKLEKHFPEKIIEYYFSFMQRLIEAGAGKDRRNYKSAVAYLRYAKSVYLEILKDVPRWERKLDEIRALYSTRRALLEELKVVE